MIVIFVDNIENFILFLNKRVMNEIFYEYKEIKFEKADLSSDIKIDIILHFLAKVEEFIVLYETKIDFIKKNSIGIDQAVISKLQDIFNQVDSSLTLVKGKIREIFLSYSS